jgi:hypothetical protein
MSLTFEPYPEKVKQICEIHKLLGSDISYNDNCAMKKLETLEFMFNPFLNQPNKSNDVLLELSVIIRMVKAHALYLYLYCSNSNDMEL